MVKRGWTLKQGFKSLLSAIGSIVSSPLHVGAAAGHRVGQGISNWAGKTLEARLDEAEEGHVRIPSGQFKKVVNYLKQGDQAGAAQELVSYGARRRGYIDVPEQILRDVLYEQLEGSQQEHPRYRQRHHYQYVVVIVGLIAIMFIPLSITGFSVLHTATTGSSFMTIIGTLLLLAAFFLFFRTKK